MMFVSFYVKSDFNKDYIDNIVLEEKDIFSTDSLRSIENYIKNSNSKYYSSTIKIINWKRL